MNVYSIYALILIGGFSFIALIVILGLFGKIIKLQLKYWFLAKKGYIKVEHIGEDKVRRTYFLKPNEDKFDIEGGFFAFQKDSLIKDTDFFPSISKEILNKKPETELSGEEKEYKRLLNSIGKMRFSHDAVALNWGVPTIIYYGQDVNPIKPSERKKIYDGKIFKAVYMRLLLLKEWKFIRMAFIVIMICLILLGIFGVVNLSISNKLQKQNAQCINMLNETNTKYYDLINRTLLPAFNQRQEFNGTIITT